MLPRPCSFSTFPVGQALLRIITTITAKTASRDPDFRIITSAANDRRRPLENVPIDARTELRVHEIHAAADTRFAGVMEEEVTPSEEQQPVLRHATQQVLNEEADADCLILQPIVELVHGEPGTGKANSSNE